MSEPGKRPNYGERQKMRKYLKYAGNTICPICGEPLDWSIDYYIDPKDGKRKRHPDSVEYDHIDPLHHGGANTRENAQALHRRCNRWKWDKLNAQKRKRDDKPKPSPPVWSADW